MLFNFIAENYITQVFFILAMGACYIATMFKGHVAKEKEAERQQQRAIAALQTRVSAPGKSLSTVEED